MGLRPSPGRMCALIAALMLIAGARVQANFDSRSPRQAESTDPVPYLGYGLQLNTQTYAVAPDGLAHFDLTMMGDTAPPVAPPSAPPTIPIETIPSSTSPSTSPTTSPSTSGPVTGISSPSGAASTGPPPTTISGATASSATAVPATEAPAPSAPPIAQPTAGAMIKLTVHQRVFGRAEFENTAPDRLGPIVDTFIVPVETAAANGNAQDPNAQGQRLIFDIPTSGTRVGPDLLDLVQPGIYPIQIEIVQNGTRSAQHLTFLERIRGAGIGPGPFQVAVLAGVDDIGPIPTDEQVQTTSAQLDLLAELGNQLAQPIDIALPPRYVTSLASPDTPLGAKLRTSLAGDELLALPLVPIAPSAAATADAAAMFRDSIAAGTAQLAQAFPDSSTTSNVWVADADMTHAGAELLASNGFDLAVVNATTFTEVKTQPALALPMFPNSAAPNSATPNSGTPDSGTSIAPATSVVPTTDTPPSTSEATDDTTADSKPPTSQFTPAPTPVFDTSFLLETAMTGPHVLHTSVVDPAMQMLDPALASSSSPADRAVRLMATMSSMRQGRPALRGMVLTTPDLGVPNPAVLNQIEQFVAEQPDFSWTPLRDLAGATNTLVIDGQAAEIAWPKRSDRRLAERLASYEEAKRVSDDAQSMLTIGDPMARRWTDTLSESLSTNLTGDEASNLTATVQREAESIQRAVQRPQPFGFTLTGSNSLLRVQLTNQASVPLDIVVKVSADRLQVPSELPVRLEPNTVTDLPIDVTARSNGTAVVQLQAFSPAGRSLFDELTLRGNVNTFTGLGRMATVGALLVLASWWLAYWRRSRGRRSQTVRSNGAAIDTTSGTADAPAPKIARSRSDKPAST